MLTSDPIIYAELVTICKKLGEDIVDIYKNKLQTPDGRGFKKIASGSLHNSIDYQISINNTGIIIYFLSNNYWINVEDGRKSFVENGGINMSKVPPIAAIKRWMNYKNISISNGSEYKIQRSIAKKGIRATNLLKTTLQEVLAIWETRFTDMIEQAYGRRIDLIVDQVNGRIINN